jgi:hypothetical protein
MRTCAAIMGAALLWGCGGGSEETETETEVETETETEGGEGGEGGDVPWEEEGEGGGEGGTAAPATGPGRITIQIKVGGEDASGELVIRAADGTETRATSGSPVTLEPGTYVIAASITDQSVLIDRPSLEQELIVSPGDVRNEIVEFARSRVRLRVVRRGRPVGRARVTLTRTVLGSQEVQVQTSDDHIPITPGRYNGVVRIGNEEITVEGITFMGGATQDVPININ